MVDIVDSATRSRMMSNIKGRNTKPELLIRSFLHAQGFRFRIHRKDLPGKPDIVLPKYKAIIFIHGCFWHGHQNCRLFKLPGSRTEFWEAKISKNQDNDLKTKELLLNSGWRICTIWECAVRRSKKDPVALMNILTKWLSGSEQLLEIDEPMINKKREITLPSSCEIGLSSTDSN
ncbi:DNA mismatch endonuclease Vsr [Acinetobacter baumannii]|uniref:very short patch repair endonuclease n=1 Tax=Acinetobacter calcoaceticus/baumannii complex TaxID=909768 RepID=UPI00057001BC|nr:DNA mismatch endonuclease Vsr [Acinetobacter baumannii]EJB8463369.1 DNA mismatch endonuclease Vsr [Acinetobacter baumannii]EKV4524500.1 DNA mismatch endonuclease Vsr [Acinetobacter baumannii]EKX8605690.1 DNA mismatch endonuclease Vsr [Acinetobacter baumannii]ELA7822393.1 DNA mismatch endonuclease Vsr [Acinetobacter baumannii]MCT9415640.1 DNA mismatch endonuclease Vsr [Acinetobacter baumannii]